MTLEQQRAALAFEHLKEVVEKKERKLYGGMALKLPALIRSAGLCQALYFVKSRDKAPLKKLLEHLGKQMERVDPGINSMETLCAAARESDLSKYVWLTREALAAVTWYGRLARSEWGIVPGDDANESEKTTP